MKVRAVSRRRVAAVAVAVALGDSTAVAMAQESYTELPAGLTVVEVLLASGLPLVRSDPDGWNSQFGGGRHGPDPVVVHYSAHESAIRVRGVSVDSVRTVLEKTLRSELATRGVRIVERPGRPGVAESPGERGDAWTFGWDAPESRASGWLTMLIVPYGAERVRLTVVSVEVRERAG